MSRRYGFKLPYDPGDYTDRIVPHRLAPVIVREGAELCFKDMNFSLIPNWSKEQRPKFATHNARLDTIESKPTWKEPFLNRRCLVPMTAFIEPIYQGDHAGHMVAFQCGPEQVMFAAGIWDSWVNKSSGELIESFSVITSDPIPFVAEIGHDRTPVFIKETAWSEWLSPERRPPELLKEILITNVEPVDLSVEHDRPMKAGWEKRK